MQGDDFQATVTVTNDDGTPADLAGYSAQSQIRKLVADEDPVVVVEIGCTIETPNKVKLLIPHAETEALRERYVWDLQLTDGAGIITTVLKGKVIVILEVTRES